MMKRFMVKRWDFQPISKWGASMVKRWNSLSCKCIFFIEELYLIICQRIHGASECVNSEVLNVQLYHGGNQLHIEKIMMMSALYKANTLRWILKVPAN
jgi:hypothetical protein